MKNQTFGESGLCRLAGNVYRYQKTTETKREDGVVGYGLFSYAPGKPSDGEVRYSFGIKNGRGNIIDPFTGKVTDWTVADLELLPDDQVAGDDMSLDEAKDAFDTEVKDIFDTVLQLRNESLSARLDRLEATFAQKKSIPSNGIDLEKLKRTVADILREADDLVAEKDSVEDPKTIVRNLYGLGERIGELTFELAQMKTAHSILAKVQCRLGHTTEAYGLIFGTSFPEDGEFGIYDEFDEGHLLEAEYPNLGFVAKKTPTTIPEMDSAEYIPF